MLAPNETNALLLVMGAREAAREAAGPPTPLAEHHTAEEWLTQSAQFHRISRGTAAGYRASLHLFDTSPLRSQIDRLRDSGMSDATLARHLRALSAYCSWLVRHGHLSQHPMQALRDELPSRAPTVRRRPMVREEDVRRLIAACDRPDRALAVELAATTGLDRGVIRRLGPDSLDDDGRCLRVTRPKTGKQMVIPLPDHLWLALAERRGHTPLLRGLHRQEAIVDWFNRARREIGRPDIWFRDLRAFASARLQRAGASLGVAQQLLGHSSPTTTARHYTPVNAELADYMRQLPSLS